VKVSIVIPAKNEEKTIQRCLKAIEALRKNQELECIVVAPDIKTINSAKKFHFVKVIQFPGDMESAVNKGIKYASYDLILKMDADIILPQNFFEVMLPETENYDLVSCPASTRSGKFWLDFFFWLRDQLLKIAPLGRSTHGNSMFFRKSLIEELGGFRYDTALEKEALKRGKKVLIVDKIRVLEFREDFTVKRILKRQYEAGRKRRQLGIGFLRTLGHSAFRGRPAVIIGWLREWLKEVVD
jgi:glycosyltransferase involved in cell wall biosynthesis